MISRLSFLLAIWFPLLAAGETPEMDLSRDPFSGKSVSSQEMAMAMVHSRHNHVPRVGEVAPEFSLYSLQRNRYVSLGELIETKPVVLIMTSWTCDVFRESLGGLVSVQSTYSKKVDFVMVYIREAHPAVPALRDYSRVPDPKSNEERLEAARGCMRQMRIPFEILLDPIDDPVATRWGSWPIRLFLIEQDGRVSYAGAQGPWGYRPYEGFVHGNGDLTKEDREFSRITLETLLKERFGGKQAPADIEPEKPAQ